MGWENEVTATKGINPVQCVHKYIAWSIHKKDRRKEEVTFFLENCEFKFHLFSYKNMNKKCIVNYLCATLGLHDNM
jgi:hypothetical protein